MNAEEIKDGITNALDDVKRRVEENLDAHDQVEELLRRELREWASARALREALSNLMDQPDSSTGLRTMALFAWWRDTLPVITSKFPASSIGGTIQNAWSSFTTTLQQVLNVINKGLWALLSTLLKVKEWALTGGVGTNVMGFTGNVEIEITFN